MSSDNLTLVERDPKTILVILRESRSWVHRWYTWVDQSSPRKQVVKDVVIEEAETGGRRRASTLSQSPVQKAFQSVVNSYDSGDIVCIFGFGEHGSLAALQLTHMLHADFAADLCHFPGTKESSAMIEEASIVQCVAVNYYRELEAPLTLINSMIAKLPSSVERVMCTNEDGKNVFACSAVRGRDSRIHPKEVWRFDCGPAWRTNRYWLIKQTADLIHYIPMHVKDWFDTKPKLSKRIEKPEDSKSKRQSEPRAETLVFETHRAHDDHIINILGDDEFDLRYQVWTL
ncbi:hypothetical protein FRC08_001553 [Ceratobasidium sp. 394]|nr:hypothetical protein FRC08_001553 [Ceratobasidium sp. 394]KAG9078348.1 hypothetical protein FS749_009666 [Ceratobasidium sp. UAMH 11750]